MNNLNIFIMSNTYIYRTNLFVSVCMISNNIFNNNSNHLFVWFGELMYLYLTFIIFKQLYMTDIWDPKIFYHSELE